MKSCKTNESNRLIKKRFMAGECALGAIKEFLEAQAKQGFKLVRVDGSNYWFAEIEPCEIKYSVEIFNKASNYDTIPAKTTEEFIEFCSEAGWDYICSRGKMLFFSSTEEDVVPIITEPKDKLKTILKSSFLPQVLSIFIAPLIMVFGPMFLMIFSDILNAVDIFIHNLGTYSYMMVALFILCIFYVVKFGIFYFSNKKRVDNGLDLVYFSEKKEKFFNVSYYILGIVCIALVLCKSFDDKFGIIIGVVSMLLMILLLVIIRIFYSKSKLSRTGNKLAVVALGFVGATIMLVIIGVLVAVFTVLGTPLSKNEKKISYYDKEEKCQIYTTIQCDELPLSVTDLGIKDKKTKYLDSYCDVESSVFGKKYECEEEQYDKNMVECGDSISYEILSTKWNFIKNSYVNSVINDSDFYDCTEEDKGEAKKWKAKKFYKLKSFKGSDNYDFVVVYDKEVLYFSTYYEDYIKYNIDVIYDKLVGNQESKYLNK